MGIIADEELSAYLEFLQSKGEELIIDLSQLEPLIALLYSPDRVMKVSEVGPIPIQQIAIGSCTNGPI